MRIPPPTISWHLGKAYGVQVAPTHRAESIARIEPVEKNRQNAQQLIAGDVREKVDFSDGIVSDAADTPSDAVTGLAMYRHPADRNAAATSIHAGRTIDITG